MGVGPPPQQAGVGGWEPGGEVGEDGGMVPLTEKLL